MYLSVDLELLVRICRNILKLNKYSYKLSFRSSYTVFQCESEDGCVVNYKFFAINDYEIDLKLPIEAISVIAGLSIKSVSGQHIDINRINQIVINEERLQCEEVKAEVLESPCTTAYNFLPELLKCFNTYTEKFRSISLYKNKVIALSEDSCTVKIFKCPEEIELPTRCIRFTGEQSKFIYNHISKLQEAVYVLLDYEPNYYYLGFNCNYKLSNKNTQFVNIYFQLKFIRSDYKVEDHLLDIAAKLYETKLVEVDKNIFIKKVETAKAKIKAKEDEDELNLILLAKEKKILVTDLDKACRYDSILEGIRVLDDMILFQYPDLDLINTLYLPGEILQHD